MMWYEKWANEEDDENITNETKQLGSFRFSSSSRFCYIIEHIAFPISI